MILGTGKLQKSCALSSVYNKSNLAPHSFGARADCSSQNFRTVVVVDYRQEH